MGKLFNGVKTKMKKLTAYIIGKLLKRKLFKGGSMDGKKKWYASKNVWTGIITVVVGLYSLVQVSLAPVLGFTLPVIPGWVFTLLGSLGVYTRVIATKSIK